MKIEGKHYAAIAALLTGATQENAGAAAGVRGRQIRVWLKKPEFRQALAEAENEAVNAAARIIATGAVEAVQALQDVLNDPKAKRRERIYAANAFLANLPRLRLLGSIEQRLAAAENGWLEDTL